MMYSIFELQILDPSYTAESIIFASGTRWKDLANLSLEAVPPQPLSRPARKASMPDTSTNPADPGLLQQRYCGRVGLKVWNASVNCG